MPVFYWPDMQAREPCIRGLSDMDNILQFVASPRQAGRAGAMRGPATVVIFPGVRIERREYCIADRVSLCGTDARGRADDEASLDA